MNLNKPQPGKQSKYTINPKTGLQDNTNGDHSFKNFVSMQWDWCLIWIVFFVISLIQFFNFGNIMNMLSIEWNTGFFEGLMTTIGMIIWVPTLIGLTFFLRDWWLKLTGEKSWNKRIIDKK